MTVSTRQGILLDEQMLSYDFGNNHVMSTNRIFAAYHLLQEIYLSNQDSDFSVVVPQEYDRNYLYKAHDLDYIDTVEELSELGRGEAPEFGLGTPDCPVWKGMADISEFVVKSTYTTAEEIYHERLNYGFVLLGGLHHATTRMASGFCYYNDVNVAIHRLKALDPDIKILYLDTDLHHGDGVQSEFYHDPNVLNISFHESGRYLFPGTGFPQEIGDGNGKGTSVNMPFFPYTWDEAYQETLDSILSPLFESFNPDYVVWQAGADAHIKDPLGHLMLTSSTYRYIGNLLRDLTLTHMDTPKVLAMGGGGYNPYGNAKSWSNALAGLSGQDLPKEASQSWIEICANHGIEVSSSLEEPISQPIQRDKKSIEEGNQQYRRELRETLAPYYSI